VGNTVRVYDAEAETEQGCPDFISDFSAAVLIIKVHQVAQIFTFTFDCSHLIVLGWSTERIRLPGCRPCLDLRELLGEIRDKL
jgi:hypothetical protein